MIEIPEAAVISGQLNNTIKGKTIQNVYANSSPHSFAWFFGDPNNYHNLLIGKKIDCSKAYAGLVEIQAENVRVLLGDGVNIRYFELGENLPPKHQLHIVFDDLTSLVCSVQMYGGLWAFIDGENDNPYYMTAKQRPSPLRDEFDIKYYEGLISNEKLKSLSAKAFLATEQRIPGLGNGSLQDVLFNAKIHPKRKMATLKEDEQEALFNSIKATLFDMVDKGGRDTEKDLFRCSGGYKTILSKNTVGKPCPICGRILKKEAYLGGSIYYCENCQVM